MKNKIIELVGWYGVLAIVFAYALSSFEYLVVDSVLYQILNLTGALGIVIKSLSAKDYQPATLNTIWFVVALIALARLFF